MQSKSYTRTRNQQLWMTCDRINRYVPEKGWRIFPGEYGAWLEVHINPESVEDNSGGNYESFRAVEAVNFSPPRNVQVIPPYVYDNVPVQQPPQNAAQVFYEVPINSTPNKYEQSQSPLMSNQKPQGYVN